MKWKSVKDEKPRALFNILVLHTIEKQQFCTRAYHINNEWHVMTWKGKVIVPSDDIEYWMPLPLTLEYLKSVDEILNNN